MNVFPRLSFGLLTCLALLGSARTGHAEPTTTGRAKGITGGALVGAEVVVLAEAALGVQPAWLYIVGGLAGAGGGAVAGYFIAGSTSAKPPSFLLAGGVALVIPTLIGAIAATEYQPPDSYKPDAAPEDDAPLDARLELPSLDVAHAFSSDEIHKYGVAQTTELHLSVLRGVF